MQHIAVALVQLIAVLQLYTADTVNDCSNSPNALFLLC